MARIKRLYARIEDQTFFCPFCGATVIECADDDPDWDYSPCEHTLFIGHEGALEYESERFELLAAKILDSIVDDEERHHLENDVDALTDRVKLRNAVKYVIVSAPSYENYIGFAPLRSNEE